MKLIKSQIQRILFSLWCLLALFPICAFSTPIIPIGGPIIPRGSVLVFADPSIVGEAGDHLARAIAGDFNGDGNRDVAVCASTSGGTGAGVVRIYTSGFLFAGVGPSAASITITGESDSDSAASQCAVLDANGDGIDDILVGATGNDDGGTNAGAAYLVYGSTSLTSMDLSDSSVVEFSGEAAQDQTGISVASAGDVNGDGYDDILIGSYGNDDGGTDTGAAYLIYGSSTSLTSISLSSVAAASIVEFTGEGDSDHAGFRVASAGDVNGDGYGDILIGTYQNKSGGINAGVAYLIYGSSTFLTSMSLSDSSIVEFLGEADSDYTGRSVTSAGDVNGDGYDDILIGSVGNDDGGINAGAVYLIYGSGTSLTSISLSDSSVIQFTGEGDRDYAGSNLAPAGDMNEDGYDDFLVSNSAKVYVILGSDSFLTSATLTASSSIPTFEVINEEVGVLGSLSKTNFMGRIETKNYFWISYFGNDDGGTDAGKVWMVPSLPGESSSYLESLE